MKGADRKQLDEARGRSEVSQKRAEDALEEMDRLVGIADDGRRADDDRREADDKRREADDGRREADDDRRAADDARRDQPPT